MTRSTRLLLYKHALEQTEPGEEVNAGRVAEFEALGLTDTQWKLGCLIHGHVQEAIHQLLGLLNQQYDLKPVDLVLIGYAAAKRVVNSYEDHLIPAWAKYVAMKGEYRKRKRGKRDNRDDAGPGDPETSPGPGPV